MKRFLKIIFVATFALQMPFSFIMGQEKKSEQKIKIIVNNGSETKVIVDTVFKGDHGPDSLALKDGSVVYLRHPRENGKNQYSVSYASDNKNGGDETREMTIISSDSMDINDSDSWNSDSNTDKTRFIIAKDGMVVTIEGTNEAKAKELAKEIEKSLGVSGN